MAQGNHRKNEEASERGGRKVAHRPNPGKGPIEPMYARSRKEACNATGGARAEKGGKVVVRILQEWENITKEVESKEDEFLSIRIQLNQGLTKTDKTLLKAIRLYMIETAEESNVLVRRGAKEEEFNFATWKLIERRMRKEEKELREIFLIGKVIIFFLLAMNPLETALG